MLIAVGWALWARGAQFYRLDAVSRVDHPDYRMLSPGYPVGHAYGFIATALVIANLSYLLRRRVVAWRLGSMRAWLEVHSATGLLAGLFALSHSALQFRNPMAAVTMVALAITLVSGIIGRFIFFLVPRPNHARLEENCRAFEAIRPGLGSEILLRLSSAPVPVVAGRVTLPKVLWLLPSWGAQARLRRRLVREVFVSHGKSHVAEFDLLKKRVIETENLAASESRAVAYDYLMRSWRGLHRFFALLMITLMVLHVGVAWYYGYRWIFSETRAF